VSAGQVIRRAGGDGLLEYDITGILRCDAVSVVVRAVERATGAIVAIRIGSRLELPAIVAVLHARSMAEAAGPVPDPGRPQLGLLGGATGGRSGSRWRRKAVGAMLAIAGVVGVALASRARAAPSAARAPAAPPQHARSVH
jgi:hypothetical protein